MAIHTGRGKTRKIKPYDPSIYEGLQLPKTVREVKQKVKEVIVEARLTPEQIKGKEGEYCTEKDADKIFNEDVDIYTLDPETKEKKLLARFRKAVIPHELIKLGWEAFYSTAAPSRNRGAAAGPIQVNGAYWSKRKPTEITKWSARYVQDGKVSKMRVNNNVFSSVLGFFETTPFMGLPCRLTSYTQRYFHQYKHGIPFIQNLSAMFEKLNPQQYTAQIKRARKQPSYQIPGTAFSSVTINRNFRTALHMDDGDFRGGFGNLSVIERGWYQGGYTIFPRYKIGFNVRTGDYLAMDVHEWHCNTEYSETASDKAKNKKLPKIHFEDAATGTLGAEKPFTRISFVCYLREKLEKCNTKETEKYYKSIEFDPVKGSLKKSQTRKKKAKN
jgi:hypothetical protein